MLVDVERGAGDFFIFERVGEGGFVHYRAARSVDEERGALHFFQIFGGDEVARVRQQRNVQADEVRFAEQCVAVHEFGVQLFFDFGWRADGVVIEDAHLKAERAACDSAADAPEAENAERFAPDVAADELIEVPAGPGAAAHPGVAFEQAAGDSHQ